MSERPGLWAHQEAEVPILLARKNHALWWDPGCGKTAPMIVAGEKLGGRQLWIVPAQLRTQIAREVYRFRSLNIPKSIQIISSGRDMVRDNANVVIVSYELARTLAIWKQLFKVRWTSLVVDEVHKLNNTASVQTHAVYGAKPDSRGALIHAADHVWISTGTPVTNHADGLYSHFSRLWPLLGPSKKSEWIERFCVVQKDFFGEHIVGSKNLVELRAMLRKAGSRKQLLDVHKSIPPLVVDTMSLKGEALDLSGFDEETMALLEGAIAEMDDSPEGWSLAQAEDEAPCLATLRLRIALAKAPSVATMVNEELEGGADRIVVFGCHTEALKRVARDTGGMLIIGGVSPTCRDAAITHFRGGRVCRVLVGNIAAMGVGLNLQAGCRIIFLDAAWTPPANEQAIGRCFRAGQERSVRATFVSLEGSVDDRVQDALARKASAIRQMQDN